MRTRADVGSRALLTDLYQITMAYGYRKAGIAQTRGCFHVAFRANPFHGGYAIACGLEPVMEYLHGLRFTGADCDFLGSQVGNDDKPLFDAAFLDELREMRFDLDVDGVPEGTVVFPNEPILRVRGPIGQCQIAETPLLNLINFQTLIATKASRVCRAAQGDPVAEFGLRRAQGPDGGMGASRACYVGGCASTSNVLAAMRYGIPASGTHAHSWVMAFPTEEEAFEAYIDALPNNAVLLVDTYDTLTGLKNAIAAGKRLEARGHKFAGVRIDSGDLAWFSRQARTALDAAGFPSAMVVASNELDEYLIESLKEQGAPIDAWGVGTRLVTADGQSSLGGVYKLSAVQEPDGEWQPRIKVSEQTEKTTTPGVLGVRRYVRDGLFAGDMVYNLADLPAGDSTMIDPADITRRKIFAADERYEELLVPVFRAGEPVYTPPPLEQVRARTAEQVACLDASHTRFLNPHRYAVGMEQGLLDMRTRLILEARGVEEE